MSQNPGMSPELADNPGLTNCSNCHAPMPRELRFCRNCGFRLGEGTAEYTETVRFADNHRAVFTADRATASAQPLVTSYGLSGMAPVQSGPVKKRKKMSGMTWMFLGLLVFFIAAAAFTAIITPRRSGVNIEFAGPVATKSYVGVDGFDNAEGGGATFGNVEPPGSPADKAGLVGGDIVTSFDGQTVNDEDDITELLANTPIGKTVDVIYTRDGEAKTTKLTTVGKDEFDRLAKAFRSRPEGRGLFGFDDGDTERVQVPGTNIFGVRLDQITPNRPADMAGLKAGDVVIEFDGIPIRTRDEFNMRVLRAIPYSTVKVVLMRGAEKLEIPVKIGKQ